MAQTNANLIWKIADVLRGPYQPNQYGDVILPFTIPRRPNTWSTNAVQTPFGGWKNSVYGREKGIESLNHYSQIKCVTIKLDRPSAAHGVPTDDTAD